MITIEVTSTPERREITRRSDNARIVLYEQDAYAHLPGHKYPVQISITHDDPKEAYAPGKYLLSPESFYVNRFGRLTLGRLRLVMNDKRAVA